MILYSLKISKGLTLWKCKHVTPCTSVFPSVMPTLPLTSGSAFVQTHVHIHTHMTTCCPLVGRWRFECDRFIWRQDCFRSRVRKTRDKNSLGVKTMGPGVRLAESQPCPCYSQVVRSWAKYWIAPGPGFPIYKVEMFIAPTLRLFDHEVKQQARCLTQCLVHCKCQG